MTQRQVEIFVAGCPRCDEAVNLVQQMSCTACQIQVWDVRSEQITATARQNWRTTASIGFLPWWLMANWWTVAVNSSRFPATLW